MKKFGSGTVLAAVAALALMPASVSAETTQSVREVTEDAAAPVQLNSGMMLYSSTGHRVAPIYSVTSDGDPQLILNGRLVTVPASTLSLVDGKVTSSLTKSQISKAR